MPAAAEGIRETDLGAELGFDRVAMRKRRSGLQEGSEWWKDGAVIMWSMDSAQALRDTVNPPAPPPPPAHKELRAVKLARNDRFVICYDQDAPVPVACRRGRASSLLGKTIKVRVLDDGTHVHLEK